MSGSRRQAQAVLSHIRSAHPTPVATADLRKLGIGKTLRSEIVAWLVAEGHVARRGPLLLAKPPAAGEFRDVWLAARVADGFRSPRADP